MTKLVIGIELGEINNWYLARTKNELLARLADAGNARRRAETIVQAVGTSLGKICEIRYGVTEVHFRDDIKFSLDENCSGVAAPTSRRTKLPSMKR